MCGRFSLTKEEAEIEKRFNARFYSDDLVKRYNVAPSQLSIVITDESPSELQLFKWGLIPSWAKDPSIGNKMINARSETIWEKPSFKNLIKRKRCLVVTDGFYEWKKIDSKTKIPYRICVKDESLFTLGGLWDQWTDKSSGEIISSFTVITTNANDKVGEIHDRMPVILSKEDESIWLNENSGQLDIDELLKPYPEQELKTYPISKKVNSPTNDSEEILEEVEI
jgi:putative SOS response-associated peptidase YedK